MMTSSPSLAVLLWLVHSSLALTEPKISLSEDRHYLNLDDKLNNVLMCEFELAAGESITEVSWLFEREIAFTWFAPQKVEVGESLTDKVVTYRDDQHLEFAPLSMDLAGMYSCKVTTSLGETLQSEEYQLVIVDIADGSYNGSSSVEDCNLMVSWDLPAILPKPTPRCGVWQGSHGYTGTTASSWLAVPYYNGSIAYHIENEPFKIVEMSLDSVVKCEVGIIRYDNGFIPLKTQIFNDSKISERGCSILEVGDNVKLMYENNELSCRYELLPKDPTNHVKAIVRCPEGTVPSYRGGALSEVQLYCSQAQWVMVQGYTWDDFDNFRCKDPSVVVAETKNFQNKETKQVIPKPTNQDQTSGASSIPNILTVWNVLRLFSLLFS